MILAGKLRHRVTVERLTRETNEYNEIIDQWRPLASVRASIEPLRGTEIETSSGELAEVTARIRMRHHQVLADLSPSDRVVHGADVYDIVSVLVPWEVGRELVVTASRSRGACSHG